MRQRLRVWWRFVRFNKWRALTLESVVVNTKSGRVFSGVAYRRTGDLLVLRDVKMLDGTRVVDMDGEVMVDVSNVDFVQVPAPSKGS